MPGEDGLSVLRMLREHYPDLAKHFLLVTGNLGDADKAAGELHGVPVLPKPLSLQQLRAMVADLTATMRKNSPQLNDAMQMQLLLCYGSVPTRKRVIRCRKK